MDLDEKDGLLSNPEVVDKYKSAAKIANQTMARLVAECRPGVKIAEMCALGDALINEGLSKVYQKDKKMDKSIAFPTCVSPNHCVGHNSPLKDDTSVLGEGDVVKIDLGVHIDGNIAVLGHTTIATAAPAAAVSGRQADVICAAHFAAEAAHRLLRPGRKSTELTQTIAKIAESFNCKPMENVLSHQMKRFVIDANKVIPNKENPEAPSEEVVFEEGEIYAIDIVMSTGEGKGVEGDTKTTIYKRNVENTYSLKMKASRALLSEANKKFSTVPFSTRNLALDERQVKLGLTECLKHDLLQGYPVVYEKEGEFVAQMKFTALILPSSIDRITAHPPPNVNSLCKIEDAGVNEILALGTKRSSKKKKNKKKKANAESSGASEE
uniref:Peptidase M24 domain-containing protein n=1 Tax=Paramoeba aestuarina TaxID=180227 RepID=A0A7S4KY95_9EUKA